MNFYFKELSSSPIYLDGKAYRFELMETDDQHLIGLLDSAAAKHIGGIIKLTQDQYLEKKNQIKSQPSSPKRQREEVRQKLFPQLQSRGSRGRNVNVAGKGSEGPVLPPTEVAVAHDLSAYVPKPVKGVLV